MHPYWVKTPKWLPKLFPQELIWKMPVEKEHILYLTFDDGPHPEATIYALDALKEYNAKASFFCIGKNVIEYPGIFNRIIAEGHTIGNHTHNHLNGWRNDNHLYFGNIIKASKYIESRNFRPPYGRIKMSQALRLSRGKLPWRIYMWDVLSGDFDASLTAEQCSRNVLQHIEPGSIVVFHDSAKAFPRMKTALREVLEFCKKNNWQLKSLPKY